MLKRFVVVSVLAVAAASVLALPAHGAKPICVSVNGKQFSQTGTATCASDPGNRAVAVGDLAKAFTANGNNNTAVGVGVNSTSVAANGNNNVMVAVGADHTITTAGTNNVVGVDVRHTCGFLTPPPPTFC